MNTMLRCEVIGMPRGESGSGSSVPRRRRKMRVSPKCRKILSRCMKGGTARGRKARAGKCMRKFQRCRRGGSR